MSRNDSTERANVAIEIGPYIKNGCEKIENEKFHELSISAGIDFDMEDDSCTDDAPINSIGRRHKRTIDQDDSKKTRKRQKMDAQATHSSNDVVGSMMTPYFSGNTRKRHSKDGMIRTYEDTSIYPSPSLITSFELHDVSTLKSILRKAMEAQSISHVAPLNYISEVIQSLGLAHEQSMHNILQSVLTEAVTYIEIEDPLNQSISIQEALSAMTDILSMFPTSLLKVDLVADRDTFNSKMCQLEDEVDIALSNCTSEGAPCQARISAYNDLVGAISKVFELYQAQSRYLISSKDNLEKYGNLARDRILMLKEDWVGNQLAASLHVEKCLMHLEKAREEQECVLKSIHEVIARKQHELAGIGESDLSARYSAYTMFLGSRDPDNASMRRHFESRNKCVCGYIAALRKVKQRQIYHAQLLSLIYAIEARYHQILVDQVATIEQWRQDLTSRSATHLIAYAPYLKGGIVKVNEFYDLQRSRAKLEVQDLMKKLDLHLDCFGDSAPIKKGDLERRIREFTRIKDKSTRDEMALANCQVELWKNYKHLLAVESVQLLAEEFATLANKLQGEVREVYAKLAVNLVSSVKETSNATAEVVPLYSRAWDDQMPIEIDDGMAGAEVDTDDVIKAEKVDLPILIHRYAVGSYLYAKVNLDGKKPGFLRGKIVKLVENGRYLMSFDVGDTYTVCPEHLFERKEIEHELTADSDESTEEIDKPNSFQKDQEGAACVVM